MTNFSDMLSKAKVMQEKMKEVQEQIKKIEVEGNDTQIFFFSSKISSKFNYYLHYKMLRFCLKLSFLN